MNWHQLTNVEQLAEIQKISHQQKVLIFKHSTTCGISAKVLRRLESEWNTTEMTTIQPYYLDLKAHRDVSNKIAEMFGVVHESPQVLLIAQEKSIFDASHSDIEYDTLKEYA